MLDTPVGNWNLHQWFSLCNWNHVDTFVHVAQGSTNNVVIYFGQFQNIVNIICRISDIICKDMKTFSFYKNSSLKYIKIVRESSSQTISRMFVCAFDICTSKLAHNFYSKVHMFQSPSIYTNKWDWFFIPRNIIHHIFSI